jgi:hypothetical protein
MKKLSQLVFLLMSGSFLYAQDFNESRKLDSLQIENLKKSIPQLQGTKKIDAINDVVIATSYIAPVGGFAARTDSIKKYVNLALKEASSTGYKKGRAIALLFTEAETDQINYQNAKDALRIAEELKDANLLGWVYYKLGGIEWRVTKNDSSWSNNLVRSATQFNKAGNIRMEAEITNWMCDVISMRLYESDEGFKYCQRAFELGNLLKNTKSVMSEFLYQYAIGNMAGLYSNVGDYTTSLKFLEEGRRFSIERGINFKMDDQFGAVYSLMGNHDSAIYFLKKFKEVAPLNPIGGNLGLAKGYIRAKRYQEALPLLHEVNELILKRKVIHPMYRTSGYIYTGEALAGIKNYDSALLYAREGYHMALGAKNSQLIQDGAENLAMIFENIGKADSAYYYLKHHIKLKDSLQSKQFLWRLNNQLYQSQRSAEEQKKTSMLEMRLRQESMKKNYLIIILSALSLAGFLVSRNFTLKRRNDKLKQLQLEQTLAMQQLDMEKKHAEYTRRYSNLEMQALRAQMKPHFIFNSLGSINAYILNHEVDKASDYLSRFSKLIRMVLNAQQPLIPLEDELKMLQLYLDMERLRLDDRFDYNITFKNAVDAGDIKIPPMLLQPFCENSIWHGFAPKEENSLLQIEIGTENGMLHCTITDDGIGRKNAHKLKSSTKKKNTSKGLQITKERLALLNYEKNIEADFEIEDLYDSFGNPSGTRVILHLAYEELVEENV